MSKFIAKEWIVPEMVYSVCYSHVGQRVVLSELICVRVSQGSDAWRTLMVN